VPEGGLADELDRLVQREDLDERPDRGRVCPQRIERGGEQIVSWSAKRSSSTSRVACAAISS
jgi:hypothetical protein